MLKVRLGSHSVTDTGMHVYQAEFGGVPLQVSAEASDWPAAVRQFQRAERQAATNSKGEPSGSKTFMRGDVRYERRVVGGKEYEVPAREGLDDDDHHQNGDGAAAVAAAFEFVGRRLGGDPQRYVPHVTSARSRRVPNPTAAPSDTGPAEGQLYSERIFADFEKFTAERTLTGKPALTISEWLATDAIARPALHAALAAEGTGGSPESNRAAQIHQDRRRAFAAPRRGA